MRRRAAALRDVRASHGNREAAFAAVETNYDSYVVETIEDGLADPDMRANVLALAGGKAIGLMLLLTAMSIYLPPALHAGAAGPSPEINALNTVWVLLAAFLVFCMQVGFVMLEAGFARSRESINILVEGIVDTCICGVHVLGLGLCLHVRARQRLHRHDRVLPERARPTPT